MLAMDKEDTQLSLLQKLMGIFQNDQILETIANATDSNQVVEVIEQELADA
jgi:PTS system galactitol-specific IIA component